MATVTETPTKVKPARIGYFTIRGSRERNPLGYRYAGVNLTAAVSVRGSGRHGTMLPTTPRGLQQLPLNPLRRLPQLSQPIPERALAQLVHGNLPTTALERRRTQSAGRERKPGAPSSSNSCSAGKLGQAPLAAFLAAVGEGRRRAAYPTRPAPPRCRQL